MKAFKVALRGILQAFSTEINLKIHFAFVLVTTIAGFTFKINSTEWIAIVLSCGAVITAELLNTAIEYLVDMISPEENRVAGQIKDISAGAVLVISITALLVGLIIFVPKISGVFT